MRRNFLCLLASAAVLSLASCTTTKFVPDGSYLLDEVKIRTDQKNIRPSSLRMYVRQNPNAKWFSLNFMSTICRDVIQPNGETNF